VLLVDGFRLSMTLRKDRFGFITDSCFGTANLLADGLVESFEVV
jgi:hypothetical protein